LGSPLGWTAGHQRAFSRVPDHAAYDFVVELASPDTTDRMCGKYGVQTDGVVSCRGGSHVVINLRRWLLGTSVYDPGTYHDLVINHEVGHFLGFGHVACPGPGRPAPVMQTQYYGLHGCTPNTWPYRDGVYITGPPAD
jgi:hypothetical protein